MRLFLMILIGCAVMGALIYLQCSTEVLPDSKTLW